MESLVQQALGPDYSVERELRGGGAARVVIARDHRLGRRVVVKILSNEYVTPDRIERFRREIQLAISLQHPHIVPILSAGDADGLAYLVMPFIEGESLRARLESGPLGVVEAVRVLRGIALALAYAHGRGVVHRDVKPDNVLLAGGTPMVADFGIAKAIARARDDQATGDHTLTLAGTSVGTPTYMAPEQIVASPDTDHRTDIYGFGVLAYEILAGTPPFRGSTTQQ
ncbi:MAG: serine/threonine protein kinase, partial [Gemmatimonadota bacterium]|nr:serine/threonine protein kinase [Gemmatimonadota bacterium]